MSPATRVLFLEMDAGDRVLIRRWAEMGLLPTWSELMGKGLVVDTMSVDGFFVGATWPSLYTGVNPARHGFHSLMQLEPGTYDFVLQKTGDGVRAEPFWTRLSDAGKRVAILDVPLSWATPEINGIQTVEWGSHDHVYGFHTQPRELEGYIDEKFGRHPLKGICNTYGRTPADFSQLRDDLIRGVQIKREITLDFLRRGGWDFFCQVFTESHCVGHQCWHIHDAQHPAHDPALRAEIGDPILDVYREIDAALGAILSEVDERTLVFTLAGHRMAHKYGAQFLLPEILVRLGVAVPLEKRREPKHKTMLESLLGRVWRSLPDNLNAHLGGLKQSTQNWLIDSGPGIAPHLSALDCAKSACFILDNGFPVSGLRLNLKGREPAGTLRPGTEADAFCETLAASLLNLTNAETKNPLVKAVKRTSELYRGPFLHYLPDLLVEWADDDILGSAGCGNPAASTLTVESEEIGQISGTNRYPRTGDHRPQGLLVAKGPGINAGHLGREVSLMDLAPTFTASLDVTLANVDGQVIPELLPAWVGSSA